MPKWASSAVSCSNWDILFGRSVRCFCLNQSRCLCKLPASALIFLHWSAVFTLPPRTALFPADCSHILFYWQARNNGIRIFDASKKKTARMLQHLQRLQQSNKLMATDWSNDATICCRSGIIMNELFRFFCRALWRRVGNREWEIERMKREDIGFVQTDGHWASVATVDQLWPR